MPAEYPALVVSGAHVQVGVKLAVHGVDGAGEGHDLKGPLEVVGVVLLLHRVEHAHGDVVHRAQGLDRGQLDMLRQGQGLHLLQDFLALVHADHVSIAEFAVFHVLILLCGGTA